MNNIETNLAAIHASTYEILSCANKIALAARSILTAYPSEIPMFTLRHIADMARIIDIAANKAWSDVIDLYALEKRPDKKFIVKISSENGVISYYLAANCLWLVDIEHACRFSSREAAVTAISHAATCNTKVAALAVIIEEC